MRVTRTGCNRCKTYAGYVSNLSTDAKLMVEFLNTLDVEHETDTLDNEASWHQWTAARSLVPDPLPAARSARAALRVAVGDPPANTAPFTSPARLELGPAGAELVATSAVAEVLAAAARLTVLGEWPRLKICPADDCRWAFYDQSRNRSRTWCSMRVCGNREKARAWRERSAGQ
ncbi:CGNR zinc finger domain-containing protein [Amycolatopsis acidicola]|uniref:CGNR zinc finger domain-containing protein n=1 Tax=Amycolatopsis acidicola TaxID=2596893 RepID=A0A5N0VEZ7_9PSEU|nr:CGNR zinc finger domain-containing protein [Amycolatopsis acidicola]